MPTKTETKTTPGVARLNKNLGSKGAEALRATVLADQAKAAVSAAKPETAKPAKAATPVDANKQIKLLVKENPHGEKTKDFGKWILVSANLTVGGALQAGVDRGYLNYAVKRKLIAF